MRAEPFAPPPIPVHLASYPIIGGLVIPFITLQHANGKAALGLVDPIRLELCLRGQRCGVCGSALVGKMVFLMRDFDLDRKCSTEPALCPPCAAYTQKACPMLNGQMAHYRASVSSFVTRHCDDPKCLCRAWQAPDDKTARLGAASERWFALWTLQYQLIHDEDGRLAAGFAGLRVLAVREIKRTS